MTPKKANSRVLVIGFIAVVLLVVTGSGWYAFSKGRSNTPPVGGLDIGSTMIGKDGATLVYVPAGKFTMGSDSGDYDQIPVHEIHLNAFWIDQKEVTNKQYAACVSGGGCIPPADTSSSSHISYYGDAQFDEFPVINVDWNQAHAYCSWAGRELPTEAQWEKAARGTDGRKYPWGNDSPDSSFLNSMGNIGDTTKTGSYENGKSFYGAYDMAGNVWEWVNDWYDDAYYQNSPRSNPLGPNSGQARVLRGGSWSSFDFDARSANRYGAKPTATGLGNFGFRCAISLP